MDTDETDGRLYSTDTTEQEATVHLDSLVGQSYYEPDRAGQVLLPLVGHCTDEWLADRDTDDPSEAVVHAIADEQQLARDARGITTVPDYNPVISGADISALLVEMLGAERSDYSAVGFGSTADGRYRANVAEAFDRLPDDLVPDEGDGDR